MAELGLEMAIQSFESLTLQPLCFFLTLQHWFLCILAQLQVFCLQILKKSLGIQTSLSRRDTSSPRAVPQVAGKENSQPWRLENLLRTAWGLI